MSVADIIKAWKDEQYRSQLATQGKEIPECPVGMIELEEIDFDLVNGDSYTSYNYSYGCSSGWVSGSWGEG